MNDKYIILDIETTYNPSDKKEEIIEICAIRIDDQFNITEEFHTLVNPLIPLSEVTKRVTGILDIHLSQEDSIKKILPKFLNFISNNKIIAHNATFDYKNLKNACNKWGFQINNQFIDSLVIAKRLLQIKKYSLKELKKYFAIELPHHRAKDDVISLIKILKALSILYDKKLQRSLMFDLNQFSINYNHQITLNF